MNKSVVSTVFNFSDGLALACLRDKFIMFRIDAQNRENGSSCSVFLG